MSQCYVVRTLPVLFIIFRSVILRMGNVSDESCRESPNADFVFNSYFENHAFYEIRRKNIVQPGRHREDNVAHAQCMLDNKVYKHTVRINNTYSFSTATMFAQTRLNVALYVHCLSCIDLQERKLIACISLKK